MLIACSNHEDEPPTQSETLDYKAILNVSYGSDSKQVYDIYLPQDRTLESKIILLVHGGGWNAGDKNDMNGYRDFLRDQLPDVAIVNINYRLADENNPPHPMQMEDLTLAIDHIRNQRSSYIIGEDLGFIGVSAGGHLSLLWSYAHDSQNKVNMVCSIVGPTNLADEAYINSSNQELKDLIYQFGTDTEVLKSVSPLYQVKASSPSTQLFYGGQDPLIPNSQGIDLNAKLQELNVPHEFTLYPNAGHGWVGLDLLDTSIKLKAFIEAHL